MHQAPLPGFCRLYPNGSSLKRDERKYLEDAGRTVTIFDKCGLQEYNTQIADYSDDQSKERSDESYPESDYINKVLKKGNHERTRQLIQQIERDKVSSSEETREKAFFAAAEL